MQGAGVMGPHELRPDAAANNSAASVAASTRSTLRPVSVRRNDLRDPRSSSASRLLRNRPADEHGERRAGLAPKKKPIPGSSRSGYALPAVSNAAVRSVKNRTRPP